MTEVSPFRDFMAAALHGDDAIEGYYSRRARTVGRKGDFSTSATLHPALGEAVAEWIKEKTRQTGIRHLIECGPGDGSLCRTIARSLGRWRRMCRRLRFHLVETGEGLIERQRESLAGLPVTWHRSIEEALEAVDGEALVYSNEFADAFPVHLLAWNEDAGSWKEIHVEHDGAWKVEAEHLRPFELPSDASTAALAWESPPDGQRIELGLDYGSWLEKLAGGLRRGSVLTIDYGAEIDRLYRARPGGTLRAYRGHQMLTGAELYREPGLRDLTADVNFTDLQVWGEELGFETETLVSQREFLLGQLGDLDARAAREPALAFLLDADGAGEAFRVLIQRRN